MTKDKTAFEQAKEELVWLKKTANDDKDLCRIVGFEDCLRLWQAALTITPEDVERCADIVNGAEYGYIGGGYYGVLNPKDVAQAVLTEFVKVRG